MTGALANIRVLDFSRLAPGPMATMVLGDLGAEVIKVEEPGGGRRAREERTLKTQSPEDQAREESKWRAYSPLERNKRSIVLDLRSDRGHEIAIKLAQLCDVVVEGFRPGVMKRLGLDYESIRAVNPLAVYCSISGYGHSGSRSMRVGHDLNYLAYSGALSLIGTADGKPVVPINLIADYAAGSMQAVIGILAALLARLATGTGQFVDISMTDGVVQLLAVEVARFLNSGRVPKAGAYYLTGGAAYYNVYETKDGKAITIACNEPHFYRNLCELLDLPELIDGQLGDAERQHANREILQRRFRERPLHEWVALMTGKDIPFAPVLGVDQVVVDAQLRERGVFVSVPNEEFGDVIQVASPIHLSETPPSVRSLGPRPGQDSRTILNELGYGNADISNLVSIGVVGDSV
jgi:crotonobetainyl-CoA:carnitine CoA-transferase CaiB-like acyl-CoA transferase